MSKAASFFIGSFQLNVVPDAYLVEVSFVGAPPRQDRLTDLPSWTLSSKHAVWLLHEDQPMPRRAEHADEIKKELVTSFVH